MSNRQFSWISCLIVAALFSGTSSAKQTPTPEIRLAITIDDLPWVGPLPKGDSANDALTRIAAILRAHQAPAIGFVVCDNARADGQALDTWVAWGNLLGNHTQAHRDLNTTDTGPWLNDVKRCHEHLQRFDGAYQGHFRFPMLHHGNTPAKVVTVREQLERLTLRPAYVTVDNSEWILTQAHAAALEARDGRLRHDVGKAFIEHVVQAVRHADAVAKRKLGRAISQVLLLHANTLVDDKLDELLLALRRNGVKFISIDEALKDAVFERKPEYMGPKGLSWLYRIAPLDESDVQWDDAEAAKLRDRFRDALNGSRRQRAAHPRGYRRTTTKTSVQLESVLREAGQSERMRSLLVMHRGKLVGEAYYNGAGPNTPANLKSITKTFVSTLVGAALRTGHLKSVDEPIGRYLSEDYGLNSRQAAITIAQLLTMSSGLEPVAYGAIQQSDDWIETLLEAPVRPNAVGQFNYDTPVLQLLSAVLSKATGMDASAFAQQQILDPMNGSLEYWRRDANGFELGGNDAYLRARDLLKLGELYRRDGQFNDRTLVPDSFVEASVSKQIMPDTATVNHGTLKVRGYGYLWWLLDLGGEAAYAALGHGGQKLVVVPGRELVVAMTSRWPSASSTAHYEHMTAILVDRLLPLFPKASHSK